MADISVNSKQSCLINNGLLDNPLNGNQAIENQTPSKNSANELSIKEKVKKTVKLNLCSIEDPLLLQRKMSKNLRKAMGDHNSNSKEKIQKLYNELHSDKPFIPLKFSSTVYTAQGERKYMEDRASVLEIEGGLLACVCDGHESAKIPELVQKTFNEEFLTELEQVQGHVPRAFQNIVNKCHKQVEAEQMPGGSTAVMALIKNNTLYVGTLGDSEAAIVIKKVKRDAQGNVIKTSAEVVECSRVINWSTPEEAKRAAKILGIPLIEFLFPFLGDKRARFPYGDCGLNVSRAVGDLIYQPGVIQDVDVVEAPLKPNDDFEIYLILASDGVWDYEKGKILAEKVMLPNWDHPDMAKKIGKHALKKKLSQDNVSVVAIKIQAA